MNTKDTDIINLIRQAYLTSSDPWYLGYSGGKDSSVLLLFTLLALLKINPLKINKPITIFYCDSCVEIPILNNLVIDTLTSVRKFIESFDLPIIISAMKPEVKDRFFSNVIGKGYPPPTNKFRWCTDRLKIRPFNRTLNNFSEKKVVLLGIRNGESKARDKKINNYQLEGQYSFKQTGNNRTTIFAPLINYSTDEIVSIVKENVETIPSFNNIFSFITSLSNNTSELPNYENSFIPRLGCWTCTVIRKDKAMEKLISLGYKNLIELNDFRNWLVGIRDIKDYRSDKRRNGQIGLGPFILSTRKLILDKLIDTEKNSGINLISREEIIFIKKFWQADKNYN